jgi:hypothetical protein
VRSPSPSAKSNKTPSRVASKLAGALADADADGDEGDEFAADQRAPKFSSYLRSEEEKSDDVALAALEQEGRARLEVQIAALVESGEEQGHLRSEWLERYINVVVVKAGFFAQVDAAMRRQKQMQPGAAAAAAKAAAAAASAHPGAEFLPPSLSFLAHHPGSYFCAQGVLRDVVRCSHRLHRLVRHSQQSRSHVHEGAHPHTGQSMLSVVLCEDEPRYARTGHREGGEGEDEQQGQGQKQNLMFVQMLQWLEQPVVGAFLAYAARPFVWRLEKKARQRLEDVGRVQKEHQESGKSVAQRYTMQCGSMVRCSRTVRSGCLTDFFHFFFFFLFFFLCAQFVRRSGARSLSQARHAAGHAEPSPDACGVRAGGAAGA